MLPAEWSWHERTLISWPVKESMCYPELMNHVVRGYVEICNAIAEFEPVTILVNPDELESVQALFHNDRIQTLPVEHNDAWLRDNGPTFLVNKDGERAGVNWQFNAWGGKYAPWDLDDAVAPFLLQQFNFRAFNAPLVMEGGSIHTDGEGTLLTTEECLLNTNRNPLLQRSQIESYLREYVNVDQIIWLRRGLAGDETDGHVDNVACFAAPGKVIVQVCSDPKDENFAISRENLHLLQNAIDARGMKLDIVTIEQPPASYYQGQRLTLSYLNFYFVNGGIILPVFGGAAAETDRLAEATLQQCFPDRRIRTIDGMAIIREGGNVHCTTQQLPAGRL
jgi:agmatine deiminase